MSCSITQTLGKSLKHLKKCNTNIPLSTTRLTHSKTFNDTREKVGTDPALDPPNPSKTVQPEIGSRTHVISRWRPKRDPTEYGIQPQKTIPNREEVEATEENINHPLWKFFHNKESISAPSFAKDRAGREWTTRELRTKSFEELHKLWYIVLMERNALLTERQEIVRRMGLQKQFIRGTYANLSYKLYACRKSMAHIKHVVYERRRAEVEALEILQKDQELAPNQQQQQQQATTGSLPNENETVVESEPEIIQQSANKS